MDPLQGGGMLESAPWTGRSMASPELHPNLRAIDLAGLDAAAALRDRVDRKYVLRREALCPLLEHLAPTHRVLEIEGRRRFGYASTYYDSDDLRSYRDHLQGRRRRYKSRRRDYLAGGGSVFEVKFKGARGRTLKRRTAWAGDEGEDALGVEALGFLDAVLLDAYALPAPPALRRELIVGYDRITLADPAAGERVTCDLDLCFAAVDGGRTGRLRDEFAVVEVKSAGGAATTADLALRALGAHPADSLSKYMLGIGLIRDDVVTNPLRPLLHRWCEPCAV